MSTLQPYVLFNGTCEAAFHFYQSVFGGSFEGTMRFKDVPQQHALPPGEEEKIMHIALPVGAGSVLMGSDVPAHMGAVTAGDNFQISISAQSKAEADRLYQGLSSGGNASMPMADAFWGAYFGMLTDRFGIHWMVSYDPNYTGSGQ
jgi:PhnB protein